MVGRRIFHASTRGGRALFAGSAALGLVAITGGGLAPLTANASSHREAPLTSGDPKVDNTDVYAFVSPDSQGTVTLIANWLPFQEPNGGPNFYSFQAGANYDINIDSDGDAVADVTYRWVFTDVDDRGGDTFLYNNGPVTTLADENLLFKQTYTLTRIQGLESTVLVADGVAAPSFTGETSMPDYPALRTQAIEPIGDALGGGQTFAGQADDPFFLDLRVFDLLYGTDLTEAGHDTLAGYNVQTIALQVPKSELALAGNPTRNPVIGVWSATSKQTLTLAAGTVTPTGPTVQVSRLGNPLINEVISPANLKDAFNGSQPNQDAGNDALVQRVLSPELPKLIEAIYGLPRPAEPRNDLVEIFLTGIGKAAPTLDGSVAPIQADLNAHILNEDVTPAEFVPAEELRLNMSVPVAATPNRLGVLAADLQGFPNGRRLTDDVLDIALQTLVGAAATGEIVPALAAGDGVNANNLAFGTTFPYIGLPNAGSVNEIGDAAAAPPAQAPLATVPPPAQAGAGTPAAAAGVRMPVGGVDTGLGGTIAGNPGWVRLTVGAGAVLLAAGGIVLHRRQRRSTAENPA